MIRVTSFVANFFLLHNRNDIATITTETATATHRYGVEYDKSN